MEKYEPSKKEIEKAKESMTENKTEASNKREKLYAQALEQTSVRKKWRQLSYKLWNDSRNDSNKMDKYHEMEEKMEIEAENELKEILQNAELNYDTQFRYDSGSSSSLGGEQMINTIEGKIGNKKISLIQTRQAGRASIELGSFGEGYATRDEKIRHNGEIDGIEMWGESAKELYEKYVAIARLQSDNEFDTKEEERIRKGRENYKGNPRAEIEREKKEMEIREKAGEMSIYEATIRGSTRREEMEKAKQEAVERKREEDLQKERNKLKDIL